MTDVWIPSLPHWGNTHMSTEDLLMVMEKYVSSPHFVCVFPTGFAYNFGNMWVTGRDVFCKFVNNPQFDMRIDTITPSSLHFTYDVSPNYSPEDSSNDMLAY